MLNNRMQPLVSRPAILCRTSPPWTSSSAITPMKLKGCCATNCSPSTGIRAYEICTRLCVVADRNSEPRHPQPERITLQTRERSRSQAPP